MEFKSMLPVPDSVHGFWWKAARWEVFFLLFLVDSFFAARYFPNDFVVAFCLQFGLLCVQLLGSLAVPAGFRLYTGKQGSIAVSAGFACVAAAVFNMFSMWVYRGRIPQENPLPIIDFILTVVAGYKVVRREGWVNLGGGGFSEMGDICSHDRRWCDCSDVFLPIFRVRQGEGNRMCDFGIDRRRELFLCEPFCAGFFPQGE